MKLMSLAAIAVIGLMLATALSGCTGAEKTSGIDTATGTGDTGVGNITTGTNESGNVTENQTSVKKPTASWGDNKTLVLIDADYSDTVAFAIPALTFFATEIPMPKGKLVLPGTTVLTATVSFAAGDGVQVIENFGYSLDGSTYSIFLAPMTIIDGSMTWSIDVSEDMCDKETAKQSMWSFVVVPVGAVSVMPTYHLKVEISK